MHIITLPSICVVQRRLPSVLLSSLPIQSLSQTQDSSCFHEGLRLGTIERLQWTDKHLGLASFFENSLNLTLLRSHFGRKMEFSQSHTVLVSHSTAFVLNAEMYFWEKLKMQDKSAISDSFLPIKPVHLSSQEYTHCPLK